MNLVGEDRIVAWTDEFPAESSDRGIKSRRDVGGEVCVVVRTYVLIGCPVVSLSVILMLDILVKYAKTVV